MTGAGPVRLGIVSPVVTAVPGVHGAWEGTAGIEDLAVIAAAADELGFEHLTCSEHVAVPTAIARERGGTYWDPLATFGYLAARTTRIRFVTQVLVLGYHHPLEIAKRYGTLDVVSGGRVVLGVGVGSLEEEFDLLGAPYDDRGSRADEALRALRSSLGLAQPSHHGDHYSYEGWVVEPHALQPRVPLWVGGRTMRSLRRAVTLGDGWVPFGLPADRLAAMLAEVDAPAEFEVVLSPARPLDPSSHPERCAEALRGLVDAGATVVGVSLRARSRTHYLEQMEHLVTLTR